MKRVLQLLAFSCFLSTSLWAHIGSPIVVADGIAGPYPLRVVIRPPDVIPGRAQIDVQFLRPVAENTIVTVLPVTASAGLRGAPRPDEALASSSDPSLRHSELWLMTFGSYSVHVAVRGPEGAGTFIVPLDAVATRVLPMPQATKIALTLLGVLLFAGAVSLVAAAAKEGTLGPRSSPARKDRIRGWLVGIGASIGFGLLLIAGKNWWVRADLWHRSNEIYHPFPLTASVSHEGGERVLRLAIDISDLDPNHSFTVLPDHGKLMHLFMVRQPTLDAFAHLHPVQTGTTRFAVTLPPLPDGDYTLYADITTGMGFAATLTTRVALTSSSVDAARAGDANGSSNRTPAVDPDDSWIAAGFVSASGKEASHLERIDAKPLYAGEPLSLDFRAVDPRGQPVESEPYMGMLGHAAIRKNDGSVFAHLHPLGTISMASQRFFATQAAQQTAGAVRQLPELCEAGINVSFPYEFPAEGAYRIWVQTRVKGQILTGVFDLNVLPAK